MLLWIRDHFSTFQMGLGAVLLLMAWLFFRPKPPESQFRVRESDRLKSKAGSGPPAGKDNLAEARMKRPAPPLALPGIRLDGAPHEILGVKREATRAEIQQAYRELMKRYHPDRVAPPGTQPWRDAQRIAEIINRAKDELLKR